MSPSNLPHQFAKVNEVDEAIEAFSTFFVALLFILILVMMIAVIVEGKGAASFPNLGGLFSKSDSEKSNESNTTKKEGSHNLDQMSDQNPENFITFDYNNAVLTEKQLQPGEKASGFIFFRVPLAEHNINTTIIFGSGTDCVCN